MPQYALAFKDAPDLWVRLKPPVWQRRLPHKARVLESLGVVDCGGSWAGFRLRWLASDSAYIWCCEPGRTSWEVSCFGALLSRVFWFGFITTRIREHPPLQN